MAYRNKTYVCFDADMDMKYYRTLQMWKQNSKIDFSFSNAHELNKLMPYSSEETIKRKLRERMLNTKLLIVLIGEKTRDLYKYVRWEIELALKLDIPIIAVNLNKKNRMDEDRCPPILRGRPVVHIPFTQRALIHAYSEWPIHYPNSKNKVNLYWDMFD
ncbi:TIR domain-containing protein [Sutcliffiella cohnii]|uniref:TIR domain-containing protein n=1 Tax=Sutcliffiella cohnii TaxID=33932 RepID=UPI002E1C59EF|nr:TIR domain-containing protein [Sutcliffiella cohnii]